MGYYCVNRCIFTRPNGAIAACIITGILEIGIAVAMFLLMPGGSLWAIILGLFGGLWFVRAGRIRSYVKYREYYQNLIENGGGYDSFSFAQHSCECFLSSNRQPVYIVPNGYPAAQGQPQPYGLDTRGGEDPPQGEILGKRESAEGEQVTQEGAQTRR